MPVLHIIGDSEKFDLIIFKNLDKSMEYVFDGVLIQQSKVHVW